VEKAYNRLPTPSIPNNVNRADSALRSAPICAVIFHSRRSGSRVETETGSVALRPL
jgi:hypothetical protein